MNLKQAQMLEILSRTHSVSEAAAELGTSQPRLTQQLKAVEAELGVDLFLRSPRGLVLSDAGSIPSICESTHLDLSTSTRGSLDS